MTLAALVRMTACIVIGLLWVIAPIACKSTTVVVEGGSGLIGARRVKVGENFIVWQEFDRQTGADWKIGAYDRSMLQPVPRFAYETASNGSMRRVYEFKAMVPGRVDLVFLRRNREPVTPGVPPPEPDKKVIKIRIVG